MKRPAIWFGPSDKVVLVDGNEMNPSWWTSLPVPGRVYCVREVKQGEDDGSFLLKLVGIFSVTTEEQRKHGQTSHAWFAADRFRLAGDRGTATAKKARRSKREEGA